MKRMLAPRGLILLYHRIGDPGIDPWDLAVTPQHFDQHLAQIRSLARPTHFRDLPETLRPRHGPAICVTFDDGYADNLLNAKPLLEKHGIPATVFVTTGGIDNREEFWWDDLERMLLDSPTLPARLNLKVNGDLHAWELSASTSASRSHSGQAINWKGWHTDAPTMRHRVYGAIWKLMQSLADDERSRVRGQLREWSGTPREARPTHRTMSSDEVVELARGELVDIGSHTVSHPRLGLLARMAQVTEIQESRTRLETILSRPVTNLAYPFGHYSDETIDVVRDAGFRAAASTAPGCLTSRSDAFRLPRLHVRDVDGESFARLVQDWFDRS